MVSNQWVGNYYLTANGSMATNQWIGNYWLDASGKWDPSIVPHVHTEVTEVTKPATCTEPGIQTVKCSVCGEILRTEEISIIAHKEVSSITRQPTCSKPGVTSVKCAVYGTLIREEEIPMIPHNEELTGTKNPTCQTEGVKTYTCKICGHTRTEAIPTVDHSYVFKETIRPTCSSVGYRVYECNYCHHVKKEEIPMIDHSYVDTTIPGTCKTSEKIAHKCPVCGYTTYEETGKYGDHVYIVDKQESATCTKDGYIEYRCKECGDTYSETLEATGHNLKTTRVEPTCASGGYEETTCSKCDSHEKTILPRGKHDYKWVITIAATDDSEGIQSFKCKNCNQVFFDETLPKGSQNTQDYEVKTLDGPVTVRGFYNHDYEQQVFEMLNAHRVEMGVDPLSQNPYYVEAAAIRGREQAVSYSHTRPNGLPFYTVMGSGSGYGENIALMNPTSENVMQAWKDSNGHNENMLRNTFRCANISCFFDEYVSSDGHVSYNPSLGSIILLNTNHDEQKLLTLSSQ